MKKFYCLIVGLIIFVCSVKATHNRAGEITYRQISAYTFEFTITTFTYYYSVVEQNGGRTSLEISWGDNTSSSAIRESRLPLQETYYHNIYKAIHTFPGPGVYEIVMQDPNRNYGVLNIPNSVNVIFSVKTTMIINPQLGVNNTPELLNYPIDKAALGRTFIHNPAAYDLDGDSLSYKIAICTKENGIPIDNYSFPRASDTLYVNPITGDLVWNAPMDTGIFNIAMNVEEWRDGVKIGNIERDMQVEVYNSLNKPPLNPILKNLCVEAGTLIDFPITSTDADNDAVKQYATGGPFVAKNNKATFEVQQSAPGRTTSRFRWQTDCSHVRKQPYTVVIKSEDNYAKLKLVDLDNFNIKVLAPAPKSIATFPSNHSIYVKWSKSVCPEAIGYDIYRRTSDGGGFHIDSCAGGIPAGSGYRKIATSKNINDTVYIDNNNGQNLSLGIEYCYRVVAIFDDGAVSYPSKESCTTLIPGTPALTSASVTKISPVKGEVFVSWIKPRSLDTIPAPGPYEYRIYRSVTGLDNDTVLINVRASIDLNDTTFTDSVINTIHYPYYYKVKLYNNTPGNRFVIGNFETASTMYPDLYSSDNQITVRFAKDVPWVNNRYIIYRKNIQTLEFDSIGYTDTEEYYDTGLANGQIYSYRVKAYGYRQLKGVLYNTLNWSHINNAAAIDTTKPCPPTLTVTSVCDSFYNKLKWPIDTCSDDIVKYNIYYKKSLQEDFILLTTLDNNYGDTMRYIHTDLESAFGYYMVSAVDSFNNESFSKPEPAPCSYYKLPNVFTPNDDQFNNVYKSKNPYGYVKRVDMKIFNRWGKLVFRTTDPDINWDGKDADSKQHVSTGVYYYLCDVYEPLVTGEIFLHNMTGFIYVYYNKNGTETTNSIE